jgi:hypothetical protein
MTRIQIRIVFVAYHGTNFPNGSNSHDQSPSWQCSRSRFYHDLPQSYGIALFEEHCSMKLAVRGKIVCDLPQWRTNFFKNFFILPKYISQGLKFWLGIRIYITVGWMRIFFLTDPNPWKTMAVFITNFQPRSQILIQVIANPPDLRTCLYIYGCPIVGE